MEDELGIRMGRERVIDRCSMNMGGNQQGKYMATAGGDGRVRIWDLRTYKMLHGYQFSTAVRL